MAAAKENLDTGLILTIGIVFAVIVLVLILLVQAWFFKAQSDEYVRKIIEPRAEELLSATAAQQEALHSYKVLDAQQGTVAIPIERAMELVAREGL